MKTREVSELGREGKGRKGKGEDYGKGTKGKKEK